MARFSADLIRGTGLPTRDPMHTGRETRATFQRLAVVAMVALAPKCLLCIAGYVGIGSALGLAGPELCGDPASQTDGWIGYFPLIAALGILGFIGLIRHRGGSFK